jgi:L-galactose dehydrogenase
VDYCESVGADITTLALQFAVHHPGIATTLVGTASPENIRKNVAAIEAPIDFELMARVLAVLQPIHNHNFTRGRPENRDALIP